MDDIRWAIARELPYLRRYARTLEGNVQAADDLVQASLERALTKHHLWLRRGSLRNWLFRIVYRTFLNQQAGLKQGAGLNRRIGDRAQVRVDAMDYGATASATAPAHDARLELDAALRALQCLPAGQRAALVLVVVEGLAYEEAADVLGVPVGTVRAGLSRARDTLRSGTLLPELPHANGGGRLRRVK